MSAPNRNTLWGRVLVDELAAAGVNAACVAPGSRSTPLVVALADHDGITVARHLDERSAAFFALGRAKRTGRPVPVVTTSGTAAANCHPAVVEADRARVPMLLLTADRPPEQWDSGANQTVDQVGLYGDAVRWDRTLPEPAADPRTLRMLRTTAARAVARSLAPPAGPVHLNVPFRKPLEPTVVPDDVPDDFAEAHPRAATGRDGPFVRTVAGRSTLDGDDLAALSGAIEAAERGLLVAGPEAVASDTGPIARLATAAGFPLLADPLSGARFGPHVDGTPVCGGYDGYLDPAVTGGWDDPDLVLRFGASPTSAALGDYLARTGARQLLVDPAGGWREATFTATDRLECDPGWLADALADRVDRAPGPWHDRVIDVEERYWELTAAFDEAHEGRVLAEAIGWAPDPATVFVSNSMPVRDLDRFARPAAADLTVLGNRGASGIDGITSTALGAGSATDDPLVLITGDLAFFHDLTGLFAAARCGVNATMVVVNNDGGGIFHRLPIASFDPPFTEHFLTPHGLEFAPAAELFGLDYERVDGIGGFREAYRDALEAGGSRVVEVVTDAAASHRARDRHADRVRETLGA